MTMNNENDSRWSMIEALKRITQIPELRQKIGFTLLMLALCRVGVFIPVPGINGDLAVSFFKQSTGGGQNLFQLVDMFSGGAFSQMTVAALAVVPYISASIILQMLTALMPGLQREMRENPEQGKRKVGRWTRILTLGLAAMQSGIFAKYAIQLNASHPGIVAGDLLEVTAFGVPWLFFMVMMSAMTTGTILLMWIGEQISERGIGNGISLIITIGILSQLPSAVGLIIQQLNLDSQQAGQISLASVAVLMGVFVIVTIATIMVIQGQRRIPLQYARRVVGRREVQGGSAYIPLKINYAGVIPVIFASSLLMFPATIGQLLGAGSWLGTVAMSLSPGSTLYWGLYIGLIIFFTYFWTSTQFHPDQIASDMKKNGAFIPGVRQGKPTQDYLESTMNRITLIGAIFLAAIAVMPAAIGRLLGVSNSITYFFGGTSLLILVGVVLDTMKQIESHLIMKRYDGFMKRGKIRGR
ncbi:Protein translocase subunit SecY [Chlamydiales bacterium SCGC AG-110-P3]|nr:Protein translocase subunit SecY [Chlamydiales bacterium SCGC AG-110-P3]